MKKHLKFLSLLKLLFLSIVILTSCSDDSVDPEETLDYSVKEYGLERDPSVNVWGAGIDFVHSEDGSDYEYLTEDSDFSFDVKFYTVKAYYTNKKGEVASQGCPALLLASGVTACKIGEGVSFFEEYTSATSAKKELLTAEPQIDYEPLKDDSGNYDYTKIDSALATCIIGQSFRTNKLEIADDQTEQDVQAVYLIETLEGNFVKFMVKQFKGDEPNEKQSIVMWQILEN